MLRRCFPVLSTALRRWLLAGAVLIVLLAQWLALVHAVVHAGGQASPALEAASSAHHGASSLVQRVAGHDAGSAACLLLDQLAHATPCADPPMLPLPALAPTAHDDTLLAPLLPAEWADYRARGPPVHA